MVVITNATRVMCRVLALLARGGALKQNPDGTWATGGGEKINAKGQTLHEHMHEAMDQDKVAAHKQLVADIRAGKVDKTAKIAKQMEKMAEESKAAKAAFGGARVTFDEGLYAMLVDKGFVKDDKITDAGREYLSECKALAAAVVDVVGEDCYRAFALPVNHGGDPDRGTEIVRGIDPNKLDEVLVAGFQRGGLSRAGAVQGACMLYDVIDRLGPEGA